MKMLKAEARDNEGIDTCKYIHVCTHQSTTLVCSYLTYSQIGLPELDDDVMDLDVRAPLRPKVSPQQLKTFSDLLHAKYTG